MKIRELLEGSETTSKMPPSAKNALGPSLSTENDGTYYDYYRFTIAAAAYPGENVPIEGPIRDDAMITPYSDIEYRNSQAVLKRMGMKANPINPDSKSAEMEFVQKTSPVRQFKDLDGVT